ncbi:hypothetical protein HMPREF9630_00640 [Peptoanaerobacter stomatis]|uniref:SLH domain-containing protein n=1 Tax=Peptoanaerobacter stomatis TaxID=796937 RepID=V9HUD6_9FIRM|nr:S-layer homology domain-containing protein [Peptoanaerobacter stomatis]EHL15271.1 hypothetical protein HMPREF9630_00640 [Peptoanaerobacter stomatis]
MSKKIDKRKTIVESKKGICCTLLATGLLLQTCSYPVFADTGSSISNLGSFYVLNTSQSDLQLLNDRIGSLEAPTQAEDGNIVINEHSLNLDVGDEFQLKLINIDGSDVNDVEWFVRVRVPQDTLYTAESFSRLNGVSISINDGLVKAKAQGNVEIWAKKGDALYKCVVNVEKEKDSLVEKKVEEIADKFRHLSSDVDKLMAVHDYLIDNIEYSNEHIVSYAYGALIEGKAVCQGYSQSFQKIIDKLNIEGRTLKGWSTAVKPEFHQWNRVKLDDGWYFVDVTWDDLHEDQYRSYKHFLINSETLGKNHKDWVSYNDEVDGTKYTYYAYKKQGVFANNREELEQILRNQINSTNLPYVTIRVAIPNSISDSEIISTLKSITGGNPSFNELNRVRDTFGTHQFYSYEVSNIPAKLSKDVSLLEIKPTNNVNETTTSVMLTFDQDIDDLTVNDIKIDDVHKTAVNKIDNKTYELTFKDMMFQSSKTLPVEVSKRGFNIANSIQNVDINIVKEQKPNAIFKATGDREGRLENVERGMRYDLGDGIWRDINSSEPVNVTTKYQEPILIQKQSTTDSILHSDVQKILPRETTVSPMGIKAVNSVGDKNNGKIIYVNRKMEYKKKDAQDWTACIGKEVTGLAEGEYLVRYKSDGLKLASQAEEVKINVIPEENNNSNESNNGNGGSSTPDVPEQSTEEQNKPNPKPDSQKPSQPSEEQNKPSQKPQDSKLDSQKTPEEQKDSQKPKQKEEKSNSGNSGGGGGGSSAPSKSVQKSDQTPTKTVTQEKVQEKSQISQSYQETSKEIEVSDIMTVQEAEMTLNKLKDTEQITWSKQSVIKVMQKGIMTGDTNGNFMPRKSVTRAEVAQVIANIIGEKTSTRKITDVDNNKWYAKAVQTVLENKIFTQDEKGNFRPESQITRAELFVVIAKLKDIKPLDNTRAKEVLSRYTDVDSIPSWATGYASALVEKGIVSGANNKISANDMLTREQLATIFANIVE